MQFGLIRPKVDLQSVSLQREETSSRLFLNSFLFLLRIPKFHRLYYSVPHKVSAILNLTNGW